MKSGTIEATVLSPEESLVAQKMGYSVLLDFTAKGIEFPHVNVVARENYLEKQTTNREDFYAGVYRLGPIL
jgi:DNA helicase IV